MLPIVKWPFALSSLIEVLLSCTRMSKLVLHVNSASQTCHAVRVPFVHSGARVPSFLPTPSVVSS